MMPSHAVSAGRINGHRIPNAAITSNGDALAIASSPLAPSVETADSLQPTHTTSGHNVSAEHPSAAISLPCAAPATPSARGRESKSDGWLRARMVSEELRVTHRSELSETFSIAMGLSFFVGFVCGAGATAIILLLAYWILG